MQSTRATVTHGGALVQIRGSLPSNAPALLGRTGAFLSDGAWWCEPAAWPRIETLLRAVGVPLEVIGTPTVVTAPAVQPIVNERQRQASVSLTTNGQIRVQGDLPKPMHKWWLGSDRSNGHVGMSPWALDEFLDACKAGRIDISLSDDIKRLQTEVQARRKAVDAALATSKLPDVPLRTGTLREYQRRAIAFGRACRGQFFIADEVGAGKSVEAIAWKRDTGAQRIIVICPNIAKGNWADEIARFDGDAVKIIDGYYSSGATLPKAGWVITNYDTLAHREGQTGWVDVLAAWKPDLIIPDEAHAAKGHDSARSKALRSLSRHCRSRVPMSGTPMSNGTIDLWAQLDAVQPGWWGTWFEFGLAWCNGHLKYNKFWDMTGTSNLDVLTKRLRYVMLRRPKSELLPELPPQTRTTLRMDLLLGHMMQYAAVYKEYQDFVDAVKGKAKDEEGEQVLMIESRTKRTKFLMKLRQISGVGRVPGTVELVQSLVEAGKRPVVFAYFVASLEGLRDGLRAAGLRVGYIRGGVDREEREAIKQEFLAGKLDCLVGQTEAMGIAINLQSVSDTTVTHELTYKPIDIIQTEGRVHRSGAVNPTQHYYCLGEGTRDSRILDILLKKMSTTNAVMGGLDIEDELLRDIESDFFQKRLEDEP